MERSAQQVNETIIAVDKLVPSPAERARLIYGVLRDSAQDVTDWDVVCFCAESLGLMSSVFPWLEADARKLSSLVYTAHYMNENWKEENELQFGSTAAEPTSKAKQDSEGSSTETKE